MGIRKHRSLVADSILLLVAIIWGGGFVAGKLALEGLVPASILMWRFCGSAVLLGLIFRRRIAFASRRVWRCGALLGLLQFFGLLVQLFALQYTTSAKQSFLAASYVCFTPLTAWLVAKVKPLARDLLAAVIALIGVGLISLNATLQIEPGDPMTLVFALIFSLQIVLTTKYAQEIDPIVLAFFQFCCAGFLSVVVVLTTGSAVIPSGTHSLLGLIYLVLINTALALTLQNLAQRHAKASHAALILSLESVFGLLFSVLIVHEALSHQVLFGCALVLFALTISKLPSLILSSAHS